MEHCDLIQVSEETWKQQMARKRLSLGLWKNIDSIKNKKSSDLWRWCARRLLAQFSACNIEWYTNTYQPIKKFFQEKGTWVNHVFWDHCIPKSLHYTYSNWVNRILFGSDLMIEWSTAGLSEKYWCCVFLLQEAGVDDLLNVWTAYNKYHKELIALIDRLISQSWFWHFDFRSSMEKIKKRINAQHTQSINALKKRYSPTEDSLSIANMMIDESYYQQLFKVVYSAKDLSSVLAQCQVHYPNWAVLLQSRIGKAPVDLKDFKSFYLQHRIETAKENAYTYGCIIERVLAEEDSVVGVLIANVFPKTMSLFPYFWYQFRDLSQYHKKSCYQQIDQLIKVWVYQNPDALKALDDIEISRVPMDQQTWLIGKYSTCLQKPLISAYVTTLMNTWHQLYTTLDYHTQRSAQILWRSIKLVLVLPAKIDAEYITELKRCLCAHQYLSEDVMHSLQSYMLTVAKYTWCALWQAEEIEQLIGELAPIKSTVLQRGLMVIHNTINQLPTKRSLNDLS